MKGKIQDTVVLYGTKGNVDGADFYLESRHHSDVPLQTQADLKPGIDLTESIKNLEECVSKITASMINIDVPEFFQVPERYKTASFETIKNPSTTQKELIKLLRFALEGKKELTNEKYYRLGLAPEFSIYVHGSVGVGKTHICSAYLNELRKNIQKGIAGAPVERTTSYLIDKLAGRNYPLIYEAKRLHHLEQENKLSGKYQHNLCDSDELRAGNIGSELVTLINDPKFIQEVTETLKEGLGKYLGQYFLHDIAFLEFERIFNVYQRDKALIDSLIKPRVLLLDDLHPKGNEERAKLIQDLLEARYNQQSGVTIVTSNLAPEELMKDGAYSDKILKRLLSRCEEMFIPFDINDAEDYRKVLGKEKRKNIKDLLS